MRAAIYVRVSTDKQELNNQLISLNQYCQRSNLQVVGEYTDVISGAKDSRPGFDNLFLDAHKKKFDILIFWALDRFSRSGTLFTLQKLHELDLLGITWHSFQEPYFSSVGQFKDVVLSIMATLAKIERERLSERTKAGLVLAKRVGKRGKDRKPRDTSGYFARFRKGGGQKKGVLPNASGS